MVTTLSPNASDTPTRPIPTCGKPAAITALPHPANVSQKVPMASAAYFFLSMFRSPGLILDGEAKNGSLKVANSRNRAIRADFRRFECLYLAVKCLGSWTFQHLIDTGARLGYMG